MEGIFGVGPLEILLVLILALILLGPQDMVKTARQLGRAVYRLYHSPIWRQLVSTQQELRDLPTKFVREAGLEETIADLKKTGNEVKSDLKDMAGAATADLAAAQQEVKSESQAARDEALGVIKDTAAEIKAAPASLPYKPNSPGGPTPVPPVDPPASPAPTASPAPSEPPADESPAPTGSLTPSEPPADESPALTGSLAPSEPPANGPDEFSI